MKMNFKIDGMKELQKSLKKLGEVPQKHVTASARKGMNIPLKEAKAKAPVDTGNLKKGIVLKAEKSKTKGKKTYRIVFNREMNDIFQKPVENPGVSGSKNAKSTAYYPVSQEYGFFAINGRYIPGYKFGHKALESTTTQIEKTIVSTMKKKIDGEIQKRGLK